MNILVMRFETPLQGDDRVAIREGSVEKFRALDGLEEKYYLGDLEQPSAGGIYLFDTDEQLQAYLDGPIVSGIQGRYQTGQPPSAEQLTVRRRFDAKEPAGPGRRLHVGNVRFDGIPAVPSDQDVEEYAERSGLQQLFWVHDTHSDRYGVLGVWADVDDLDTELRGDELAALSGAANAKGEVEYRVDPVARVLREDA